jgi:predicted nucleic acid-binding protein
MIVVADSSPLHDLILLGDTALLQQLYSEVLIPQAVADELTRARAPSAVREWISALPPWVRVATVTAEQIAFVTEALDEGERAAIAIAENIRADLLLIDDSVGRAEARRRRIRVTGTLGVLRAAAERGLVNVPDLLTRLHATNFYVDDAQRMAAAIEKR